jgi:hypothetical protein
VETDQGFQVSTIQLQPASSWWKSWRLWLLAALAPAVRAFLEQTFPKRLIGDYVIFTLDEQATAQ